MPPTCLHGAYRDNSGSAFYTSRVFTLRAPSHATHEQTLSGLCFLSKQMACNNFHVLGVANAFKIVEAALLSSNSTSVD